MEENVELFLLDGAENLLLGHARPFMVNVGDLVDIGGEIFEVMKKFPLFVDLHGAEMGFISGMYEDIAGREPISIHAFYRKIEVKEDETVENDQN